jgi:hypothetical protein
MIAKKNYWKAQIKLWTQGILPRDDKAIKDFNIFIDWCQ